MRYLATLIGVTDETAIRYFVLVVALLLDPKGGIMSNNDHADDVRLSPHCDR